MHPVACAVMLQRLIRRSWSIGGKGAIDHVVGSNIFRGLRQRRPILRSVLALPDPGYPVQLRSGIDETMLPREIHEIIGVALKLEKCPMESWRVIWHVVGEQRQPVAEFGEEGSS